MSKAASSRISIDGLLDGAENMRRDLEMFSSVEARGGLFARIYRWDGAWVSLGRSQNPERVLKNHRETSWVIRPTGGGGVLHGHDITVSIVRSLCKDHRKLRDIYRQVITPLVSALRAVGVHAFLGEDAQNERTRAITDDCFLYSGANDVVDATTHKKLIGVAMKVSRQAVLAQCSIPVSAPLIDPAEVFANPHTPNPLRVSESELITALSAEIEHGLN